MTTRRWLAFRQSARTVPPSWSLNASPPWRPGRLHRERDARDPPGRRFETGGLSGGNLVHLVRAMVATALLTIAPAGPGLAKGPW
jgi:hypothetical protein